MNNVLKILKKRENAVVPQRATSGSAGIDLCACIDEPLLLKAHTRTLIPTGIAIGLPSDNFAAFVFARSSLGAKKGVSLSNGVGVIDSDYRGEVHVGLQNLSDEDYLIQPQERIAQLVVMPVAPLPIEEVTELDATERGDGGFGSTGKGAL